MHFSAEEVPPAVMQRSIEGWIGQLFSTTQSTEGIQVSAMPFYNQKNQDIDLLDGIIDN